MFLITSCSISKACESIDSIFSLNEIYFKPQRCYVIPNFACLKPIHSEFLNCENDHIYVEYFIIENDFAIKFSYDNLNQLNWFAVGLNDKIYVDTDGNGEFDTEYDITDQLSSLVPRWAKLWIGPTNRPQEECIK